jgi:pimeloyl-ACP methyl ester carboxylesterase
VKKTLILILPGWDLQAYRYQELKTALGAYSYIVDILNFPEFGAHKFTKEYEMSDYVRLLEKRLSSYRNRHIILFGHSFGGRVSILYASKNPKDLDKLILCGVPGVPSVSNTKRKIGMKLGLLRSCSFFRIYPFSLISLWIKKIVYRFIGVSDYVYLQGKKKKTFQNIIYFDLIPYMKKIRTQTFLLWGESDTVTPVSIAYRMKQFIPSARLEIIPKATHKLPYEDIRSCAKAVHSMIKQV